MVRKPKIKLGNNIFTFVTAARGLSSLNISDCSNVGDFGVLKLSGHENLRIYHIFGDVIFYVHSLFHLLNTH